jgi:hypothetical protein
MRTRNGRPRSDARFDFAERGFIVLGESWPGNRCCSLGCGGGKSGLRRIGCQVTPGGREPTESATESETAQVPQGTGKGETVR